PHPRQLESLLRLRGGRRADDGAQGRRAFVRLGLHLGLARAFARAQGLRRGRRPGALLDPLRDRAVHHRGRGGLRGGAGGGVGSPSPGHVTFVRNGEGRYRSEVDRLDRPLIERTRTWPTATRSSTTTRTPATSGRSTRTIQTWGRASWARPRAEA